MPFESMLAWTSSIRMTGRIDSAELLLVLTCCPHGLVHALRPSRIVVSCNANAIHSLL